MPHLCKPALVPTSPLGTLGVDLGTWKLVQPVFYQLCRMVVAVLKMQTRYKRRLQECRS